MNSMHLMVLLYLSVTPSNAMILLQYRGCCCYTTLSEYNISSFNYAVYYNILTHFAACTVHYFTTATTVAPLSYVVSSAGKEARFRAKG